MFLHDIHSDSAMPDNFIYRFVQGQFSKVAILDESDEGTMREVHKIAVAEPAGTSIIRMSILSYGRQNPIC